jgi:predicted DNA-binding protein with PD1-like motif
MPMPDMRHIHHPGPVVLERTTVVTGRAVPLRFVLEPGDAVDVAIAKGFADRGCIGGFVMLRGGTCDPFRYVMPAASPDGRHAAWYSGTFAPEGPVRIERAGTIVGWRDGNPFVHCHGIWNTPQGTRMGHLLGPDTGVTESIEAIGIGLEAVTFKALPDPETDFTLFEPVTVAVDMAGRTGARAVLAKVRPNADICTAIGDICLSHRIASAVVYGIGSLNGVRYADGGRVEAYATEVLIREGRVESVHGRPSTSLDVDVVDMDGRISSGTLVPGDNPVCITFELVIVELDGPRD